MWYQTYETHRKALWALRVDKDTKFRRLSSEELPPGIDAAFSYTSVCINTAIYLPWLVSQCLANGVVFKRATLKHISEAAQLHYSGNRADVLVNCAGLMALKLGGVNDQKMLPARGQTVLVRNDPGMMCSNSGTDDGDDEVCYVMQRAAGESKYFSQVTSCLTGENRRRDNTGRVLSERELGFAIRPQPCNADHETRSAIMSCIDRWQRL